MERQKLTRREFFKFSAAVAISPFLGRLAFGKIPEAAERSQGERVKTPEELRVESIIEAAYRLYFREFIVGDQKFLLRIPFGQNYERFGSQEIFMGGKGNPESFWQKIETLLKEPSFIKYQEALLQPGKKLVLFNTPRRSYQIFSDEEEIEKIKARFKENKLYPYEMKEDASLSEIDIYNFLYCLGRVGIDCAGFSFNIQRFIASQYGVDLCKEIGKKWGIKPEVVPLYIGTWYYESPWSAERVDDRIVNLRPGDVILFPDRKRPVVHSVVIQSVDFQHGQIRYVQCTDWVFDRRERGPHESEIIFDPTFPEKRLSDPSLEWTKKLGSDFEGISCPYGNETDGFRYRLTPYKGKVVRLKRLAEFLKEAEPLYYTNF